VESEPILIHSLFRTGSTFIWNCLRQVPGLCAYYEPFHPELAHVSAAHFKPWRDDGAATDSISHPRLDRPYLDEYRPLLRADARGVPLYQTAFAFDDFLCRDEHPEQKNYLDSLIAAARPRRAVLQFNRTAMRAEWFRMYYPDARQFYLVRHPDHQFQSQLAIMHTLGLDTFPVMDLMAVAINRDSAEFAPLTRLIPLPYCDSPDFSTRRRFFSRAGSALLPSERYALFYYLWFSALLENLGDPASILSIDALSLDAAYRRDMEQRFSGFTGLKIEFPGAAVRRYAHFTLDAQECAGIRRAVQALILANRDSACLHRAMSRISVPMRKFLALDQDLPQALGAETTPVIPGLRRPGEIHDAITDVLGADLERRFEEKRLLLGLMKRTPDGSAAKGGRERVQTGQPVMPDAKIAELSKKISQLLLELEENEQKNREQSVAWTRQVENAEEIRVRLQEKLDTTRKELHRALAETGAARETVNNLSVRLNELTAEIGRLRQEVDALRNSRWYRLGKKLGLVVKPQ
jgi:hypothetical protein